MQDVPTIERAEARPAAALRLKVPRTERRSATGPAYGELMDAVAAQGAGPAGPWYSHES